jgi:type I site-specific restriction endonuclease
MALQSSDFDKDNRPVTLDFQKNISNLFRESQLAEQKLKEAKKDIQQLKQTNLRSSVFDSQLNKELVAAEKKADDLLLMLNGYAPKASTEEIPPSHVPIQQRLSFVIESFYRSSEPVNEAQKQSAGIIEKEFSEFSTELGMLIENIKSLKEQILE